ncbi:glycogen operon protein [Nitrosospira sp. Nsp5]|uniref:Glycogen operon protein n=1 Tax=Nitrosospira multiformis TaxID=1231 RepID=A0ABY0TQP8_9PROT|nr:MULTISPECIES: glycogen debranching protein GlgX [Nitrosospira]PTR10045.1 glycogen operon protein [Nitrosospira sp. Nsp5]SDQ98625.1 glycogen operon protein [Nitrosospira multiformis]
MTPPYPTRSGTRFPPGATVTADGVNFCIFSQHATGGELVLYAAADTPEAFQTVVLDAEHNRSFFFWHVFVVGLPVGTYYTWRMDGPNDWASTGRRFYPHKELLDPWARAVSDSLWDRCRGIDPDTKDGGLRAIVVNSLAPPVPAKTGLCANPDLTGAVIYELHVGGFTRHPSAGVSRPGLFPGLKEKIPYLKELGITHVEFLPVMAYDTQSVPWPVAEAGLSNYWGYNTYSFWAPHPKYCFDETLANQEFRDLVDAFHAAGIGVLLDVVFNHTAEGGEDGPVISFRGLGNDAFYHLDASQRQRYLDFTGCGNTVNCNHPLVSSFIVHCLEYWVETFGVDGFRFDLASVFARGEQGVPLANPPLPWAIETSHILSHVPVIAEAWDAAGLYQVGAFPGMAWSEWNGHYRDIMRRFVRGDPGLVGAVATRLGGSADLYAAGGRCPTNSINFITCHDGFTLYDLVSYNGKHNEANGEDNRDGTNDNLSWNCGAEGDTGDAAVLTLRRRQAKNLMALLMLSRGVPMLLAGDEVLRSQRGNNNAYCQDNELSWFDWGFVERNNDMLRYTRELIALRRRHPSLTANKFFTGAMVAGRQLPDIAWHGMQLNEPLWHDPHCRVLACTIAGREEGEADLHVIMNMSEQALDAPLPFIKGRQWYIALDTALASPQDISLPDGQIEHTDAHYLSQPRSIAVLEAR